MDVSLLENHDFLKKEEPARKLKKLKYIFRGRGV